MNQSSSKCFSIPTIAQEESQTLPKSSPIPTTAQQTFPPFILSTFREFIIVSIKDEDSQLILAKTCKPLYECYERHYKDKTAVVLYNPKKEYHYFKFNIRRFQLLNGCLRLKFSSIWDPETDNYLIKILCLNQKYNVPELDHLSIDALITFSPPPDYIELIASLTMFTRLNSLSLCRVIFDNNALLRISNLSSIKFIQLEHCKIDNQLFEKCTIPRIQVVYCEFYTPASIKLPSSLKIFAIYSEGSYKMDASDCTQLGSL
jgi:hypothetical protein